MPKLLSILALVLSLAALTLAATVYMRADIIADQAVQRREQKVVDHLKPKVHAIYRDLGLELTPSAKQPKSLEDLFTPMFHVVTDIQDGGNVATKSENSVGLMSALESRDKNMVHIALWTLEKNDIDIPKQIKFDEEYVVSRSYIEQLSKQISSLEKERRNQLDESMKYHISIYSPIWASAHWD